MIRKRKRRYARRVQVRFWERGNPEAVTAYTTNISATGMFIGTASPLAPGARVRIEVLDPESGFMLEGLVIHSARVSPLLKKLRESGMGVRFLGVRELVADLLPSVDLTLEDSRGKEEAAAGEKPDAAAQDTGGQDPADAAEPLPDGEPGESDAEALEADAEAVEADATPAEAAATPDAPDAPVPEPLETAPERRYSLRFSSLPQFLGVLERDIEKGGIFIATPEPAPLEELVTVRIHVPAPVDATLDAPARVVQRIEPGEESENLLAGFGAQFVDPEAVTAKLQRLIYGG